MPFLILFVLIPLAEVYAFINVGAEIGVLKTLLLCVLTAAIGGFIVRQQGLETLFKAQNNMRTGKLPINDLFDGFCIVVAGALLLTPGFVTDIMGFSLLFPPFRVLLRQTLVRYGKFKTQNITPNRSPHSPRQTSSEGDIIEGEYEHVSETKEALDKKDKSR